MKHLVLAIVTLFPSGLLAGSLVQITESESISGGSPGFSLEGSNADTGIRADSTAAKLHGQAPEAPLTGSSNSSGLRGEGLREGLQGQGEGEQLRGFVTPPPPTPPLPTSKPEPEPEPETIKFELRDLQFEYDSAVLSQSETSVIAELAAVIERLTPQSITLVGYTDRRGSAQYNLNLSERRAIAVRDALVEWHNLDPALFSVIGRGEQDLISAGISEADHAQDRRVVVIFNE